VTVAADGALSFMAEEAALKPRMRPRDYAVGIKEIIQLSEEKINDRFNLEQNEGSAHLFTGDVTKGMFGGGFLYTNKETISLGVVVGIRDLMENSPVIETHALMEMFKKRYEIKRFIEGGTVEEYSAHIIPESGYDGISKLYGNGILVAGDAAGFALNMGVTVRGMEFAVASGVFAAESIIRAKECGDYSAQTLSYYEKRLKESFVLQDFYNFRQMPEILENKDFFNYYPNLFPSLVEKIMWFDGESKEKLSKTIWKGLKNSGAFNMKRLKTLYNIKNL
jgi:electron transfer flavoprotein-quinone oxidoreductase